MTDAEYTGPLSFTAFAVPAGADLAGVEAELHRVVAAQHVEVLDVELVSRDESGATRTEQAPGDLSAVETDLLHGDDLDMIAADLADGERALVIVYEDRSLAALASQVAAAGGRELWVGGIDAAELDDEADTTEDGEDR